VISAGSLVRLSEIHWLCETSVFLSVSSVLKLPQKTLTTEAQRGLWPQPNDVWVETFK
jgi:hypothetical protein